MISDVCGTSEADAAVVKAARSMVERNGSADRALHVFVACRSDRLDICAYLVRHLGANVNATDEFGNTPLHIAVGQTDFPVARLLAKGFGANINFRSKADRPSSVPLPCPLAVTSILSAFLL